MTQAQIIPVANGMIGNHPCLTVDGRALHRVLEVRRDFTTWIKTRIAKYGFIEGQDFEIDSPVLVNQKNGRGGDRRSQEYRLALDMGKELCMVENNDKGKLTRRYFISCEREAMKHAHPTLDTLPRLSLPSDPERKALNKLVKVWGGMIGGNQGETMPRINTQVAAHFGRTTVDDMTVEEIRDAITWVQAKIDVLQKPQQLAQPLALPAMTYTEENEIEGMFLHFQALANEMRRVDGELYDKVKSRLLPSLRAMDSRRTFAIQCLRSHEEIGHTLNHAVNALEQHTRVVLTATRA